MGDTINRRLHAACERYLAQPERRPEDADDLADDYEDVLRRIIEEHRLEEEEDIDRDAAAGHCNCRPCIDDDCDHDNPDEREEL